MGKEFHAELAEHIELMKQKGTISPEDLSLFTITDNVEEALQILKEKSIQRFALRHEEPKPFRWLFENNVK